MSQHTLIMEPGLAEKGFFEIFKMPSKVTDRPQ
jgi:hypothetical protein